MPQLNSLFWFLLRDYCHQLNLWKLNWSGGLPVLNCTEDRNTCKYSSTCWCFCLATKSSDSENASRKVCWDIRDSRASRADTRQYRPMKLGQYASKWTTQTESERTAGDGAEDTCVCGRVVSPNSKICSGRVRNPERGEQRWFCPGGEHTSSHGGRSNRKDTPPPNSTTSFTYTRKSCAWYTRNTRNVSIVFYFGN